MKKTTKTKIKKKQYDSEASKEKLKKAAIDIFSQKGFKATTTRMIAKKSGVNISLISRYFGSKEKLLHVLMREHIDSHINMPLSYTPQETFEEEVYLFLTTKLNVLQDDISFARCIINEAFINSKHQKLVPQVLIDEGDPKLKQRLQLLKDKGQISKHVDIRQLSLVIGLFTQGLIFGLLLRLCVSDDREEQIKMFAKTLGAGIK